MPKKAGVEAWKKKRRKEYLENAARNIWKRKNSDIIYSVKASRQNRYILKDLKGISRKIRFTGTWY